MPKEWQVAIGDPVRNPEDEDVVLSNTINDSKRRRIKRQEEVDEAEHQAKMAELKSRTNRAENASEKKEEKSSDSGFQLKGGLNLGSIDVQEIFQQRIQERDDLRQQAESAAAQQQQISEDLRERLHQAEMNVLKTSFDAQMEILKKLIEGQASRGTFEQQVQSARETAQMLGYVAPKETGSGNLELEIRLKEMEFNNTLTLRKMDEESKARDREFQRQLRRDEEEREDRKKAQEREDKKAEYFANTPKILGAAIGQAIRDGAVEGGSNNISSSSKSASPVIQAGIGEAGETDCINCGNPIAIGATARSAKCVSCGANYPIRRVQSQEETAPE